MHGTITKQPHTVMTIKKAEKLVETLNSNHDDDLIYKVSIDPKGNNKAIISVHCPETNKIISYL